MASPQSPSSSAGSGSLYNRDPDLSELVNYFVSAKRSLTSAQHVWRANEVVNSARVLLEENAILAAKNTFIRSSVAEQIDVLEALRLGLDEVGQRAHDEFRELLKDLDKADNRLKITLKILNETPLSRSLQSSSAPQKYLHEFINTDNYTEREQSLHECIDRYNEANRTLQDVGDAFETQLRLLQDSIGSPRTPVPGKSNKQSPLPTLLRALEVHATEIAANLQSLVHHYDLCVTALKHTEGGLPAASLATGEQELPTAAGISVESLHQDAPPAPMTASDRLDMLRVVVKDAGEVDDVVAEMRDRAGDMELQLDSMSGHINELREEHSSLISAVHTLHEMSRDVKGYVDAARLFSASWDDEKEKIIQGYHDFNSLREFFEGFLAAYEDLLVEVARRNKIRQKMEDVAREAEKKIAVLYEEDAASRNVFNAQQGEYLPVDIWPGLLDPPIRYQVVAAASQADAAFQTPEAQAAEETSVHGSMEAPPMQKERSRS